MPRWIKPDYRGGGIMHKRSDPDQQERCEARDSVGRCILPKGHAEQHDHGTPEGSDFFTVPNPDQQEHYTVDGPSMKVAVERYRRAEQKVKRLEEECHTWLKAANDCLDGNAEDLAQEVKRLREELRRAYREGAQDARAALGVE